MLMGINRKNVNVSKAGYQIPRNPGCTNMGKLHEFPLRPFKIRSLNASYETLRFVACFPLCVSWTFCVHHCPSPPSAGAEPKASCILDNCSAALVHFPPPPLALYILFLFLFGFSMSHYVDLTGLERDVNQSSLELKEIVVFL